jgi:hypothetical protein
MTLPQIEVPTYQMRLISTGVTVNYRPFLVKEKKILMIAAESKSHTAAYNSIKQIVSNCTFGKVNAEQIALFDLLNLYLKIRSKSIGETADFKFPCPHCKHMISSSIDFENINVVVPPEHNKNVKLDSKSGIMMKYPNIEIDKLLNSSDARKEDLDVDIVMQCIDYVYDGNDITYAKDIDQQQLKVFIESLTEQNYNKLIDYFKHLPKLEYPIEMNCKGCGKQEKLTVNDLFGFFA